MRSKIARRSAAVKRNARRGGVSAPHCKLRPLAACLLAAAALALVLDGAAARPQQAPAVVIRQNVRRVIVDVVVTDAHGQVVSGLQTSDFRVYEDSRLQTILHFDTHSSSQAPAPLVRPAKLPPHTYMNLPAVAENGPITVILYDLLNTPLEAQLTAHQAIVNFLRNNPPSNQTTILVLSDRLHLLEGFTDDQARLLAAANAKGAGSQRSAILDGPGGQGQPAQSLANAAPDAAATAGQGKPIPGSNTAGDAANMPSSPLDMLARAEALEASAMLDQRVDTTLDALDRIARFLSGVPGRKNLIWLSGSFPVNVAPDPDAAFNGYDMVRTYSARIRETSALLSASQVAVYPVDLRGLAVNPMFDASSRKNLGAGAVGKSNIPAAAKATQDFGRQQASEHATMDQVGEETGGRAFYDTNGLEQAMRSAVTDGSGYYSLEYTPANSNYDGSLRRIKVTLDRDGVRLSYRRGYFANDLEAGPEKEFDPTDTAPRLGSLLAAMQFGAPPVRDIIFAAHVDALGARAAATPEQMQGLVPYLQMASRASRKPFAMPQSPVELQRYAVQYAVLASQLELPATRDNVYTPDLTFAVLAFDEDGNTLTGLRTTIQDAIPAARIDEVRKDGYRIIQMVYVPVNASSLRIGVLDGRTNRIGSMEVKLPPVSAAVPSAP